MDMFNLAKNKGWNEIFLMTSFCRRPPKKKIVPCGICGPCVDAVKAGMGFRMPVKSRIKARIQIPFREYYRNNYLKHDRGIFKLIKLKLEGRF